MSDGPLRVKSSQSGVDEGVERPNAFQRIYGALGFKKGYNFVLCALLS
jgi:hypothetical protein